MLTKKEKLQKLIIFIDEIANEPGNEWFKNELGVKSEKNSNNIILPEINEIYEHCIKLIIKDHAVNFFLNFKLLEIKEKLIEDSIRMETFRRDDKFEDFCLALFQQIEAIVNILITSELQENIILFQNNETHKIKNTVSGKYDVSQKLWQLIFYPLLSAYEIEKKLSRKISEWDFLERFKAVLFFYYFNKKIFRYSDFTEIFYLGNELYQSRNLNHRGGTVTEKNKKIIDKVTSNSHRYYFKFLGFLEDFVYTINLNI